MAVDGQADGEGGPEARICHLNPDMLRAELTISSPSCSERDYVALSSTAPGRAIWSGSMRRYPDYRTIILPAVSAGP